MSEPRLIELLEERAVRREDPKLVTYLNPYSYLVARVLPERFARFDEIHADGIALVLFLRWFGVVRAERESFDMSSYAPILFADAAEKGDTVYFIGAKPEEIAAATKRIAEAFPTLRIAGCRHGYFGSEAERAEFIRSLVALAPDYVVCGMGTPLQEAFLLDLRTALWRGTGYTCGGFFHQSAQRLDYYPPWIDRLQLRWLYRIFNEPKLIRRYGWDYPKFVFVFCADYLALRRRKRRV